MNLLTDPDFELGTGWVYTGGASRTSTPPPYSGTWSGRLYSRHSASVGDEVVSAIYEEGIFTLPGVPLTLSLRFTIDGIPTVDPLYPGMRVLFDPGDGGGYQEVVPPEFFQKPQWGHGWNVAEISLPTPVGPSVALKFELLAPEFVFADGYVQIDAIELGDEEAHLVRSTALSFMDRLKGLIETIDPNIGKVYVTPKRWPTVERLEAEGTLRITGAGVLDDLTRVGQDVTRFWWMRPRINCQPLTNGSGEYVTEIELMGFYSHEDGDAQFETLNRAAIEILDAVNTKTAELETLNTGDAYLGYLLNRPTMEPIQHAQLESPKAVGNSVRITITFAEEVSYA